METVKTMSFGESNKFGVTISLRTDGQRFEVVRQGHKRGSRPCVLSRHWDLETAEAAFASTASLGRYWSQSASASYAQKVEAGQVVVVDAGVR